MSTPYRIGETLVFRSPCHQRVFLDKLEHLLAATGPLNAHLILNVASRSVVDTETFVATDIKAPGVRLVSVMNPITDFQRRRSA